MPGRSPLTLRPAGQADAALVAAMHARSWVSTYRGALPDLYLDHEIDAERLAYWQPKMLELAAGAGAVMVAERDAAAVGFVCVMGPDQDGSVLVDNLHAMPGQRGGGAGTAMLAAARLWALAQGARGMHLLVLETNLAAIGFYASRGWQLAERKQVALAGTDVVALVYRLPLAAIHS